LQEALDAAPPKELESEIRAIAGAVPGVAELDQCRIRKMGLEFYVDLHVGVNADLTVREGHRIAHDVKDAIRAANPAVTDVLVHIEPAAAGRAR
jgi:divalent metal cation (Fe/Co/Zn/Cd) transporter